MYTPTFVAAKLVNEVGLLKITNRRGLVVFSYETGYALVFVVYYQLELLGGNIAAYVVTDNLS